MGANGGVAMTVFVDGWLEGLWRVDGRPGRRSSSCSATLTKREQSDLDDEIARVEDLLR